MVNVSIVKGKNPQEITVQALEMIEALDVIPDNRPVLIKPNYINAQHPSTGITTDSRVIEGIVKYMKQSGLNEISIGEGCGLSDTFRAYSVAGVDHVAKRWKVDLIDLNKDKFVEVNPFKPLALNRVKIAKMALESTIVSVPKLKIHGSARVTLSIKNMMGVMTPKGSMHRGDLSKNIADLASLVKPSLAVVDGIIAGEGHETSGSPIEMNLVIAGKDPVAVDAVGAAVMGVPPRSVKHLLYAEQKGLGTYNLEEIEVVGEPIEKVQRMFRRSS
jgi:uncharacterized protein (DUF362 family)